MPRKSNSKVDVWKHVGFEFLPDGVTPDTEACWPWKLAPGGGKGRGKERAYFSINGRKYMATRIIWELVHGEPVPSDRFINHHCDNSMCCNPDHMYVGTLQENTDDMMNRERTGLPALVVRRVRVLLARGDQTHAQIAHLYGLDRSVVTKISNDKLYTYDHYYPSQEDYDDDNVEPTNGQEE